MSSRIQNATKRPTQKSTTISAEKAKNKNEIIKSKEDQDKNLTKPKIVDKTKPKQTDRVKISNRSLSKTLQSGSGSSRSSSSTASNKSNDIKKTSTSVNKKAPRTPDSNRVAKTQFFPTKQMYTNAVKTLKDPPKDRQHNKTITLNSTEVKVSKKVSRQESLESPSSERPRTATLTKPTIKFEPEDYEDDFDSYESDFEEYTTNSSKTTSEISTSDEDEPQVNTMETDEERKLDSGNFELPESKHKQILDNINESVENVTLVEQNRSNLTSLSDEGFEDGKIEKGSQFVNFTDAKRKQTHLKSIRMKSKRGEELSAMIKLDNQTFTVFEIESVPYNIFIKKFGNNNTIQTSAQTGHDDVSEEIQTMEIVSHNKWTQCPIMLTEIKKNIVNLNVYKDEIIGVGEDNVEETIKELKYNEDNLAQFLNSVGDVVLNLLEECSQQRYCKNIEVNANQIPFSEGCILFNTKLPHLQNIPVVFVNFSSNTTKLLTVHSFNDNGYSYICIWKISDPNLPENYLTVHGILTCCVLHGTCVYGGISDGAITIWDIKEHVTNADNAISPTFITSINAGHVSNVICLEVLENNEDIVTDDTCNSQVYSLDDDGYLIIWTVIILQKNFKKQMSLQQISKVSLRSLYPHLGDLQCTNMTVNKLDTNHLFISTNYGQLLHFVAATGTKANPKKYAIDCTSPCNVITTCPFSPFYMLAGYENGGVSLFSRNIEKPLITLTNSENENEKSAVEFVEWSKNKPCVFYTKDKNNCIHIWDLAISDIFPIYTVPFKEEINFIKLSPGVSRDEKIKKTYMVIVSDKYDIKLHILNKDHGQQNLIVYENNVKKFLNYVSRL